MSEAFRQVILEAGMTPPDVIRVGRWERFAGVGKANSNKAGFCFLFEDGLGGVYGDFSSNINEVWFERKQLTEAEKKIFKANVEKAKQRAKEEREKLQSESAESALELWNSAALEKGTHKYLIAKNVKPYGIKSDGFNLLISLHDENKNFCSVQTINPNGNKLFHKGGRTKGCYYPIGRPQGILCLVEGYATGATIHEATGHAVAVCFNADNLPTVAEMLSRKHKAKFIICADNDHKTEGNPGLTKAREAATLCDGIVAVPECDGTDFNDMAAEQGLDAVAEVIKHARNIETTETVTTESRYKFELVRASELTNAPKGHDWLIKNYCEKANLAEIFGTPESGKSLVALEQAFCIACGIEWYDNPVEKGEVVYIAGEGFEGIKRRLKALEEKYGTKAHDLHVSKCAAQILDDEYASAVRDAISAACEKPVLVVIDTLNRNFGSGDENSTKDMTQFICNIDFYLKRDNTSVFIVHHSGLIDKDRSRGSSSLFGAIDLQYKIKKEDSIVAMENTKAKDIERPEPLAFKLKGTALEWADEEGEPITAPILEAAEYTKQVNKKKLTHRGQMALKALRDAIDAYGIKPTAKMKESFGGLEHRTVVNIEHWRKKFYPLLDLDVEGKAEKQIADAKKKAFQRARDKLLTNGEIATLDNHYWRILPAGRDGT